MLILSRQTQILSGGNVSSAYILPFSILFDRSVHVSKRKASLPISFLIVIYLLLGKHQMFGYFFEIVKALGIHGSLIGMLIYWHQLVLLSS